MEPNAVVQSLLPTLTWLLLASGLGTVGALVAGALLVQGRRVPPVVAAGAVALPVLVVLGLALTAVGDAPATASIVGQRLVLPLFVGLPATVALMLAAGAGAARPPRQPMRAAAGGLLVVVTAAVVVWGGIAVEETTFVVVRAIAYAIAGAFVTAALLAGDRDAGAGVEGATVAGLVFPLVVAVGEVSARAMSELQALVGLAGIPASDRAEVVRRFYIEMIDAQMPYMWAAFGVAALVGLVGLSASSRASTRFAGAAAGLVWIGLGGALLGLGHPSQAVMLAAAAEATPTIEAEAPATAQP